LGDTLYLTNLYVLAQKGKKINKARSKLDLSYPRAHTWGGGRPTPSPTTMSHYKQARMRRNEEKWLKIEGG
jgi:hypothetical protein